KPQPKPEPKPKPVPKVDATEQQRQQAKQKARDALGSEALNALKNLGASVPTAALSTASSNLSTKGTQATNVGSVVDRSAATRSSGGVDVATLTNVTAGENLGDRATTTVEVAAEAVAAAEESKKRSQEELRLVFESYNVHYDRLYRRALRKDPTLEGSVTLALTIQPDGSVTSCKAAKTEVKDARLIRSVELKCQQMAFENRPGVEVTKVEYPIRFNP
ncbi:MAG: AgmX/PglI C-terminal domain-containing protein, partial [Pseudomonadota bacterium]|nr:AgmX/PglI C-terminal domain-containing protein [Pseudomonadota bacterium]